MRARTREQNPEPTKPKPNHTLSTHSLTLSLRIVRSQEDPRHSQQPHPQGMLAPQRHMLASYTNNAHLLTFVRLSSAQSPQNWQTTVGLPFFQIEGTVRDIMVVHCTHV